MNSVPVSQTTGGAHSVQAGSDAHAAQATGDANSAQTGCVFCSIVAGEAPAYRVHEDELSLAILDIQPLARGHCLVIPKRHVQWWHEMTARETASLFEVARVVAGRIMAAFEEPPEFVCIFARGRRIPHTHIFVVPTWRGDPLDRHFNSLEGFQETSDELAALRDPGDLERVANLLRGA
jgi:histidine triad (HIT) family protein